MINTIEKIFKENDFIKNGRSNEDFKFYNNNNLEYYLISKYKKTEIINFFNCEKTNHLIEFFGERKKESLDISKNTSLVLLVEIEKLRDNYNELENTIFKIEEDEYFFKKYIIPYTREMNDIINSDENLTCFFQNVIKNMDLDSFREDRFRDQLDFLATQIFVKLPFMSYEIKKDEFQLVGNILEEKIKAVKLDDVREIILESDITEKLINSFMKEDKENDLINDFFENFKGII